MVSAVRCAALCLLCLSLNVRAQDVETTTLPTPGTDPEPTPTAAGRDVCSSCDCKDGDLKAIDCSDRGIKDFFTLDEWAGVTILNKSTVIDLSNNALTTITPLAESYSVRTLNLSHNYIESIAQASFRDLRGLTTLDLSYNELTAEKFDPHAFEGRYAAEQYEPLGAMRWLSLSHNDLHTLPTDMFEHLSLLTTLDLSGNPLAVLDYSTIVAISSLPMLEELRLRDCDIKSIPDKFLHTPRNLLRLDLSYNKLSAVPDELEETHQLRVLNLNQNPIVAVNVSDSRYPAFPLLEHLEELHMSNMPSLTRIGSGALGNLPALRRLYLANNDLLTFVHPKALARPDDQGEGLIWPRLEELYIQNNSLTELDSRLVARWGELRALEAAGNPYTCDCTTQWMVDDLVEYIERTRPNASSELVCAEPVEMLGYTLKHLHDARRTMRCQDKYGHRPERDGAMLLGTLIGVLLAVPITLGAWALWRRGMCPGGRGAPGPRAHYRRAPLTDNYI